MIPLNWLVIVMFFLLICSHALFLYAGYLMGSRFKIVEIKENETVHILNNNPEESHMVYEEEEALVPGDEEWQKRNSKKK